MLRQSGDRTVTECMPHRLTILPTGPAMTDSLQKDEVCQVFTEIAGCHQLEELIPEAEQAQSQL